MALPRDLSPLFPRNVSLVASDHRPCFYWLAEDSAPAGYGGPMVTATLQSMGSVNYQFNQHHLPDFSRLKIDILIPGSCYVNSNELKLYTILQII